MTKADIEKLMAYWRDGAKRDLVSAKALAKARCYLQALFFEHLALEKKVKAICIRRFKSHAPYGHSLPYLFGKANIEVDAQQLELLEAISKFNISGRYPNEKEDSYKKATKGYYVKWEKICRSFHDLLDETL